MIHVIPNLKGMSLITRIIPGQNSYINGSGFYKGTTTKLVMTDKVMTLITIILLMKRSNTAKTFSRIAKIKSPCLIYIC